MLFNSYMFIFIFLPITLLLFFNVAKYNRKAAISILFLASLIFYGWLDYRFVLILLISIVVNFVIGNYINQSVSARKKFLWVGIIFNLGLLSYFKYTNFFIQNINSALQGNLPLLDITLPIGISFFTFTQIAFLVDSYRGLVKKYSFINYALFVSYFPHLIAGPIIHHKEVMPQFEKRQTFQFNSRNLLIGLALFTIGLFKKAVLADFLSYYVSPVFDMPAQHISALDAWTGALSYTFELYFDFSGYSDMAIGLSLLIGIKLPINFYSPYKAINIIEFWHRWNMTLSRFLREYVYIPLGGNRKGPFMRYINLMITMLLGGLWHGANWTFVIWGILHGIYLCVNHSWIGIKKYIGLNNYDGFFITNLSRLITFLAVVVAWVFFRSPNYAVAHHIINAMFFKNIASANTWYFPEGTQMHIELFSILEQWGINQKFVIAIFIASIVTWLLPNSSQFFSKFRPTLSNNSLGNIETLGFLWKPTLLWNCIIAFMFTLGIMFIQSSNIFLYFRF